MPAAVMMSISVALLLAVASVVAAPLEKSISSRADSNQVALGKSFVVHIANIYLYPYIMPPTA